MFREGQGPYANLKSMNVNIDRNADFAEKTRTEKEQEEARLEKLALDKKEAMEAGDTETVKALGKEFAAEVIKKQRQELTRKK